MTSDAAVELYQRLSVGPGQGSNAGEGSESFQNLNARANVAVVLMTCGSPLCRCQPCWRFLHRVTVFQKSDAVKYVGSN